MNRLTQLNTWLAPAEIRKTWFDPIFRITTSLIFVIGGIGHFGIADSPDAYSHYTGHTHCAWSYRAAIQKYRYHGRIALFLCERTGPVCD